MYLDFFLGNIGNMNPFRTNRPSDTTIRIRFCRKYKNVLENKAVNIPVRKSDLPHKKLDFLKKLNTEKVMCDEILISTENHSKKLHHHSYGF